MRRILIGGSYVGALAAGAVASVQLWMQALTVDERSAIRELALPGTQERSVPALVEPARPRIARPTVSPLPFAGFIPIFASSSSGPLGGGIPVAAPAGGGGGGAPAPPGAPVPGAPVPGAPVPGSPVPGQPAVRDVDRSRTGAYGFSGFRGPRPSDLERTRHR